MRDMFSLSSDDLDTDESASADSAIGSGGTTPERQYIDVDSAISSSCVTPERPIKNVFNTDANTPNYDVTHFPLVDVIDYVKPPGPSPYGMRRRRIFTFNSQN